MSKSVPGVVISQKVALGVLEGHVLVSDCGLLARSSGEGKKPKEHWGHLKRALVAFIEFYSYNRIPAQRPDLLILSY